MSKTNKVAISLDSELLEASESLRARTGESRSALFARAVRRLLKTEEHASKVARYVEAYREHPDSEGDAFVAVGAEALSSQDW